MGAALTGRILETISRCRDVEFCVELFPGSAERSVSFAQLERDLQSATRVLRRDLKPFEPVAILGSRSYEAYLAALASVISGHPFFCLNPAWPERRWESILLAVGARLVLDCSRGTSGTSWVPAAGELRRIDEVLRQKPEPFSSGTLPESENCYIVATSGSTGAPKLIPISRNNLISFLDASPERLWLSPGTRVTQIFDLSFDPAIGELFFSATRGTTLLPLLDSMKFRLPEYLERALPEIWYSTPGMLAGAGAIGAFRGARCHSVRQASFIGEALLGSVVSQARAVFPGAEIWNFYGPAETTIAVCAHRVPERDFLPSEKVPLGRPFPGVSFELGEGSAEGAAQGELLISGPQVFGGYLAAGETAPDPYYLRGEKRFFRTRDLVSRDSAGDLYFVGRTDWSFKVSGHRVEPQEVEAEFLRVPGISSAAHLLKPEAGAAPAVSILALEGAASTATLVDALRHCRAEFPPAQLPRELYLLPVFPRTVHGKVDREAILAILSGPDAPRFLVRD